MGAIPDPDDPSRRASRIAGGRSVRIAVIPRRTSNSSCSLGSSSSIASVESEIPAASARCFWATNSAANRVRPFSRINQAGGTAKRCLVAIVGLERPREKFRRLETTGNPSRRDPLRPEQLNEPFDGSS